MLTFSGAPALSDFRLDKVLAAVCERVGDVAAVDTRYLHFVDSSAPLTARETGVVEALLRYGQTTHVGTPRGEMLLVVPRFGTVSPWSSKATDIAHVCGLVNVVRIERGIAWHATIAGDERALQTGARRLVLSLGHAFEIALLAELADAADNAAEDRGAARRACLQLAARTCFFV